AFAERARRFVEGLVSHLVLDGGELVVAHAGLPEALQGRASRAVRDFALYGETTGETDAFGLPVRVDWARAYRGRATVVHGHTPVRRAEWVNRTLCVDTGCVFGGALTALRWPEKECVSVPAERVWCAPAKPLHAGQAERSGAGLQVEDVLGKRIVETRLDRTVTVREENAAAALEVMSRYGVDPRWLIYLPATMSPAETSAEPGMLEHPREAFAYFRSRGVREVICEEKHMGSRAVLVVCRDERAAAERFGVRDGRRGVVYTRTGRPFFDAPEPEAALLARVAEAASEAGLWEELGSSWLCLDAELMPWSAKARGLLQSQYAPVGAAATLGLRAAIEALDACVERGGEAGALRARFAARLTRVREYREAYRPYCWPVERLEDWALAPFHLLASEGGVHTDRDHRWHMETLARLAAAGSSVLRATRHRSVDLDDAASVEAACTWWRALTEAGGEGMVVKPLNWNARGRRGLLQPALKCRGPAYLRLIYGPEYDAPEQLEALRRRKLKTKRRLARKEHALGLEALHRFVEGEPLHRVHECVFGVLALESEPVDPRL
ncbi:MAG TPA: polynucleotide kinase-phosphatase, partial [Polyangiaceae bacterium LLY-WYZ-15_(1-7)]|nr:polynucleotide kinase-phosphatase [Polyangiaceae bacterium LLY-WYZ-15_(1-7)]